jgi:hypothetical protein
MKNLSERKSTSCAQVRNNTFRNCLPKREDNQDSKNHEWEVEGKMLLIMHVDGLQLSGNRWGAVAMSSSLT